MAEPEQERQDQRGRGERRRLTEHPRQLAPDGSPADFGARARQGPLSDVDPRQRGREPHREGEVVAEEIEERAEVQDQRQQRQQTAPDQGAKPKSAESKPKSADSKPDSADSKPDPRARAFDGFLRTA